MTITVQGPSGTTVQFPDGTDGATIDKVMTENFGAPSTIADAGSSLDAGLAKGVATLGGLAGDLTDLGAKGIGAATNFIERQLGMPESAPYDPSKTALRHIPTGQSMQAAIQRDFYAGAKPHEPQTKVGEIAHAVGEFAPATAGGGGTLFAKGATALGGGLGHVFGGDAAAMLGEEYRPYGQLIGGVAGGVAGAKGPALRAEATNQARVPTAEKLLETGSKQFDAVRASGATVDSNDVQIIAQGIRNKILQDGADPDAQKLVFNVLDRLEAKSLAGQPVPYAEIDILRKNLNNLKLNPDGAVRNFAKDATSELMDLMTRVLPSDVSGTLKDAIGNWAAGKRSNTVMGKAMLAEQNAGGAGAGANIDNTSRQAIKQLTRPIHNDIVPQAKRLGFNDEEVAAMNKIVGGTGTGNAARLVGKAAPTGGVSTATAAYTGNAVGGPVGAVALPVVGYVAKKIGDLSTKQGIAALDSLVRSRSPLAIEVAASLPAVTKQLPPKTAALLSALVEQQQLVTPRQQVPQF